MIRKILIGLAGLLVLAAIGIFVVIPQLVTVNAPIMNSLFGWGTEVTPEGELRERISLPDGYQINIYAEGLGHARVMRWTDAGDLLLSTPRSGEVKLIERDANGDGRGDGMRVLVSGLNRPHGLELYEGWLYIGETDAIARIRFDAATGATSGEIERVLTGLPGGGNHWTRTIKLGPDGKIYVNIGSSCNACIEEDSRRAGLLRFNPDGSGEETVATGLRNTVGFDWQPGTGKLYGVDNGRDLLGDDYPPCELNEIRDGGFYGWPFLNGMNDPDPDNGATPDPRIEAAIMPAHPFPAHVAPLAIHFLRGGNVPPGLEEAALVSFHGSWNRTQKQGYEVVSLHWMPDGTIERHPFATGFQKDEEVIGRPVDIKRGPDGAIYVSDDYAGAVYRISYGADQAAAEPEVTGEQAAEAPAQVAPQDPEAVVRGAALWQEHDCATCHDATSAPSGVALKELKNLTARYDPKAITDLLTVPPGNMPAFELSDADKSDLAAYLLDTYK